MAGVCFFFKSAIELIQIFCLLLIFHSARGWCLITGVPYLSVTTSYVVTT